MSTRDEILSLLRGLCGKRRAPRMSTLDNVLERLWCNKLVWKGPMEEVMQKDYANYYERNCNMVGVLFRRHATAVFFWEAMAAQLPVNKFGIDYSVRLRFYDNNRKLNGCLLHVTELGPDEMVFETMQGQTISVMDAVHQLV